MGASKSTPKAGKSTPKAGQAKDLAKGKAPGTHTPLPEDLEPYQGPAQECLLVTVPVHMTNHLGLGISAGNTAVTSNVDNYYSTIAGYLQQGYILNTFYRVPGSASWTGEFGKSEVPFEAIYSRPVGATVTPDESRLLVEKSTMHLQHMRDGILSTSTPIETVADTSDIMNKIIHHSSMGGQLICIEMNGQVVTQGMSAAMSGISTGIGVDVLFEIPNQPTPEKYVYQIINVPIGVTVQMGFAPRPTVHCDWLGTLATYLNQGWKLVEIFLDQSGQWAAGGFSTAASLNSVWFFEKESSRLQDPTPVYKGAVIEYFHKVSAGIGGLTVKTDWSPVITEMGNRGWELACIQQTPEVYLVGIGDVEMKLMMFFQRKIVGGSSLMTVPPPAYPGPPPAYPGSPTSMNPPAQDSATSYPLKQPLETPYPPEKHDPSN